MDDQVLQLIIEIMVCSEILGSVPETLALVLVALIGKKGGGRRPIGLLPAIYRLWAKVRQPHVRRWEADWDRKYMAAARGKSTADVAWLRALRAEYASSTGATAASILWDLKKCFEHGRHSLLAHEARELQFPLAVARLAVSMYSAPRRLMLDGSFAEPVIPSRGFIAGCSNARAAINATMLRRRDALVLRNPSADLDVYVDDIELQALARAANDLVAIFESDLGYPLAQDKAIVIANADGITDLIIDATNGKAGEATEVTSKLGIEYTCGRRRPKRGGPLRPRYKKQVARRRRLGKLRKLGCKVAQVVRMVGQPCLDRRRDCARGEQPGGRHHILAHVGGGAAEHHGNLPHPETPLGGGPCH